MTWATEPPRVGKAKPIITMMTASVNIIGVFAELPLRLFQIRLIHALKPFFSEKFSCALLFVLCCQNRIAMRYAAEQIIFRGLYLMLRHCACFCPSVLILNILSTQPHCCARYHAS